MIRQALPHPLTGQAFVSPVPEGSGWPGDPAVPGTPSAGSVAQVARLASSAADLATLDARVSVCRACPRLVAWREDVAVTKRRAFADQPYWGRPIAGWGDERAWLLVVGLAPAAHGGNRTGRIFTGDRSGDWIFAALHRAGLAASAGRARCPPRRLLPLDVLPAVNDRDSNRLPKGPVEVRASLQSARVAPGLASGPRAATARPAAVSCWCCKQFISAAWLSRAEEQDTR